MSAHALIASIASQVLVKCVCLAYELGCACRRPGASARVARNTQHPWPPIMFDDSDLAGPASADDHAVGPSTAEVNPKKRAGGVKRKRGVDISELDAACFRLECEEPRLKGKRWCAKCNKARKAKEMETLEEACSTPEGVARAMADYELENPSDRRYAKKTLINWGQFKRVHSVGIVQRDREGERPFEYKQFLKYGESIMGWSLADTKSEWDGYKSNRKINRDSKGLGGCLRLWLPLVEEKHRDHERERKNILEEGGAVEKSLDAAHKQLLLQHCHSAHSKDESFLKNPPEFPDAPVTPSKKDGKADIEEDPDNVVTPEDCV